MNESQIKPIKISPELFNLKPRSAKNKTLKKNSMLTRNIQPNKLKTDLLARIKNYKNNKMIDNTKNLESKTETEDTSESIQLSNNLPKKESKPVINKHEEEKDEFTDSINFLKNLSSRSKSKKHLDNSKIEIFSDDNISDIFSTNKVKDNNINLQQQPQYGCLKNSTLPTYRQWKKNNTLKKSYFDNSENNRDNSSQSNQENHVKINVENNLPNSVNVNNNKDRVKRTTYKYYLGKKGKKISVLVKNNETRKKITSEHNVLKQTNIHDMKSYLKRHNLIKSGSNAPPDVIKKIYEQALLTGDIRNSNKDSLIHNYLRD